MANPEHLAVLQQGVEAWNEWRKANPGIEPSFCKANLSRRHLNGANLRGANLHGAHLNRALASLPEQYCRKLQQKSRFILATNQLDSEVLSAGGLLSAYQDQQQVERDFRFLKDPLFMASTLYLKSPKRLMALMMVMTLCLLVYAALEYRLRQALQQHDQTVPNQKGQPTRTPIACWVVQGCTGIHLLVIAQEQVLVLNLNEPQRQLLAVLGERYVALYSNSG